MCRVLFFHLVTMQWRPPSYPSHQIRICIVLYPWLLLNYSIHCQMILTRIVDVFISYLEGVSHLISNYLVEMNKNKNSKKNTVEYIISLALAVGLDFLWLSSLSSIFQLLNLKWRDESWDTKKKRAKRWKLSFSGNLLTTWGGHRGILPCQLLLKVKNLSHSATEAFTILDIKLVCTNPIRETISISLC